VDYGSGLSQNCRATLLWGFASPSPDFPQVCNLCNYQPFLNCDPCDWMEFTAKNAKGAKIFFSLCALCALCGFPIAQVASLAVSPAKAKYDGFGPGPPGPRWSRHRPLDPLSQMRKILPGKGKKSAARPLIFRWRHGKKHSVGPVVRPSYNSEVKEVKDALR